MRKGNLKKAEKNDMNIVIDAFHTLGNEIKSLKEQLVIKERLAALGEVSAGIAHEFRNPMAVIAGHVRLLLKNLDQGDSRREIVHGILSEIEEMNRIMEEFLKFSRAEPIDKVDIDITKTIKAVISEMGDEGERIEFPFNDAIMAKGDEILLRQVIKNLIRNALDAGDRVWIDIENGLSLNKEGVFISVRDNGKGIPEEDLKKVFMPFYTTKERGMGIGLALVQKIIIGHGGNVGVESKDGKGSTFRLFLPAV